MPHMRCASSGIPAAKAPTAPLASSTTLYQASAHVRFWSATSPGIIACSSANEGLLSVPMPLIIPTKASASTAGKSKMKYERNGAERGQERKDKERPPAAHAVRIEGDEDGAGGGAGQAGGYHQTNGGRGEPFTRKIDAENDAQEPNAERTQPCGHVDDQKIANGFALDSGHLPAYTPAWFSSLSEDFSAIALRPRYILFRSNPALAKAGARPHR